jgi:thioredoxin-dependent peroxiredoxin
VALLGISGDSVKAQAGFKSKHKLNYDLGSDPEFEVIEAYGARRMKKFLGKSFLGIVRSTVLVGADGRIEKIWDPANAKGHAAEVLAEISKG